MKLNNTAYDILKWVALVVLPALAVLYGTVAGIWGLPYSEEIPKTVYAVDLFIGALIGVSTAQYNKSVMKK